MTRAIAQLEPTERPRERLCRHGAEHLKTAELLAIILRTGLKGKSALDLAEELLARYPSLHDLSKASVTELARIKGVGPTKAVQLKASFELASRLVSSQRVEKSIRTAEDVYALVGDEMKLLSYESMRVILLNSRASLIGIEEIARGSARDTIATAADILRPAILHGAVAFILVHNHPTGDPSPTQDDLQTTQRVRDAAKMMSLELVDHLIIGLPGKGHPKPYFSFREEEYL